MKNSFNYCHFIQLSLNFCLQDAETETIWCYLLDEHGYIFYSNRKLSRFTNANGDNERSEFGEWFGNATALTEKTMTLLLKNKFYTK